MSVSCYGVVSSLVRTWVRVYSVGLPQDIRDTRRTEMESDLWEQHAYDEASGKGRLSAWRLAARWLRGLADDLLWRMEVTQRQGGNNMMRTMASPRTYLNYIAFMAVAMALFPIGIGTFIAGLVAMAVPFGLMSAPFMLHRSSIAVFNWRVDTMPEALGLFAGGLALLVVELVIVNALFRSLRGKIAVRIGGLRLGR